MYSPSVSCKVPNLFAGLLLAVVLIPAANATDTMMPVLGGQAVYDATTNLTWVSNADLAATNTFGISGISWGAMTWIQAESWISAMNAADYLGYSDWRLPTTAQPDTTCTYQNAGSYGLNCTGSEMGNLFYKGLGGLAGASITAFHNANYLLFSNIKDTTYWSGTEYASDTSRAFYFVFGLGYQNYLDKTLLYPAFAMRTGNVAAVPEPEAWGMMLSGLALIGAIASAGNRFKSELNKIAI